MSLNLQFIFLISVICLFPSIRDVETFGPDTKIVWIGSAPIFPFKARDFCTIIHIRKLKDGTVVVLNRSPLIIFLYFRTLISSYLTVWLIDWFIWSQNNRMGLVCITVLAIQNFFLQKSVISWGRSSPFSVFKNHSFVQKRENEWFLKIQKCNSSSRNQWLLE